MRLTTLVALLAGSATAQNTTLPSRTITQFPVGVWIENIAVRSNGNLMLTSLTPNASVYQVSNPASSSPQTSLLFSIDTISGLFGIAEVAPDVFVIAGGNTSDTGGVKGTFNVWTFDMKASSPKPTLHAFLPDAILLNGIATLPGRNDTVLISDSTAGLVWRVNIANGEHDVAFDLPEMASPTKDNSALGINGVHVHDGALWWTNHDTFKLHSIAISPDGSPAAGAKVKDVTTLPVTALDDFIFGPANGNTAWVTTNDDNRVFATDVKGESVLVAGAPDAVTVATATACQFGRSCSDKKILYVSTGGGKIKGQEFGGKVEALDTTSFMAPKSRR
ncbi:hypothetical protein CDD81_6818 [Ophiocordyceps australis]|uniref:SMP-30/Gluconolactonase/LRE-like region domain-containing protein n=1 Tax=Ophiocordyceps australis TaxID=1399860 RepID=A0A2C5Y611_9HYPO|nr:hypothetical protein CDD81_6818 [Ophiocordyceps australis]